MHIIYNKTQLTNVVNQLTKFLETHTIFAFVGPLGAGKTTLIRELLKSQGITQAITSPTFTYVNAYENEKGDTFYHFDLYRFTSLDQFLQAGFDEYLYAGPRSWAFIEWPEIIMPLLNENTVLCEIEYYKKERKISFKT
jgi:tRNA threonylcarbamoyladenosine biosynthesis protein TsaE